MNYCDDYNDYENNDNSDNEDEYEGILVPKLPVANFDHFDPNLPPVSGEDYLRRVQSVINYLIKKFIIYF
jgi:hypothetical protein